MAVVCMWWVGERQVRHVAGGVASTEGAVAGVCDRACLPITTGRWIDACPQGCPLRTRSYPSCVRCGVASSRPFAPVPRAQIVFRMVHFVGRDFEAGVPRSPVELRDAAPCHVSRGVRACTRSKAILGAALAVPGFVWPCCPQIWGAV